MAFVYLHECTGCVEYAGRRPCVYRHRSGQGETPAAPAQRQWPLLHRWRVIGLSGRSWYDAYAWSAVPPADPRQDRTLASFDEEPDLVGELLSAGRTEGGAAAVCGLLQP